MKIAYNAYCLFFCFRFWLLCIFWSFVFLFSMLPFLVNKDVYIVNERVLVTVIEARYRHWSEWGSCSLTCGTSTRTRVRPPCVYSVYFPDCTVDYETKQTELCRLPDCPCKWSLNPHVLLMVSIRHLEQNGLLQKSTADELVTSIQIMIIWW